jgi:SnoaL-like protein
LKDESHKAIVERYVKALVTDLDTLEELQHPDFVEDFPQSGERIRGRENFRKIYENYPGGRPAAGPVRVVGSEDEWVLSPSYTPLRITGSGDVYTMEGIGKYPSGETWYGISIIELRDDKISRVTTYFGQPFEAPEWRAEWVEKIE